MSEADRLKEIEAKLARLKVDGLTTQQAVAEIRLDLRRLEDKLDTIILKLFAPERLQTELIDGHLSVETPEDVESLLAQFLSENRR